MEHDPVYRAMPPVPLIRNPSAVPAEEWADAAPRSATSQRALARRLDGCRLLNLGVALLFLVAFAPLALVIALLIRVSSPGPVIYRQTRVGLDRRRPNVPFAGDRRVVDYGGRLFTIYKFRTMRWEGDRTVQVWASRDDARVTPVGRLLRRYRLDEIPQLFNVLRGDMNVVGPRPEQPAIFARLRERVDRYAERQRVLPGITGWAQVNLAYDQSESDVRAKLAYDLHYIGRRSVATDVGVLLRTIPVIVFRRGSL